MQIRRGTPRVLLTLAGLCAAAAVAAGCGSSDESSTSTGSSSSASTGAAETTAAKPTGEPIKIMTMAPIEASSGTSILSPETAAASQATVNKINAEGGINGRPIDLIICDEHSDPNAAAACARKAEQEKVVALVATYSQFSDKAYPILEKAKIANLGDIPVTAPDGTSDMSFPVNAGSAVLVAIGQAAAERPDCKKPGLVQIDSTAKDLITAGVFGGILVGGKQPAYNIALSPTSQDYSSQANEAADKGDCVVMFTVPGSALSFIPAFRQISDQPIIASNNSVSAEVAKKLSSMLEGTVVPDYFPPYNSDAKADFRETMDKYAETKDVDFTHYNATNAYVSVNVFKEIAETLGDNITNQTFLAALQKAKDVDTGGLTPPLNFTKANEWKGVPFQKRIFNRNMVYTKIDDGEQVQDGGFRDLTKVGAEAFAAAAGK
jgi:ABC-type branched-subunit amino acid transport system substrate-binding protein